MLRYAALPTTYSWILLLIMFVGGSHCRNNQTSTSVLQYNYGTSSDSARYYFQIGWQEIMDYGRWTESEAAFRKAVTFDPDWLLGMSMIGRITQNTQERQTILHQLTSRLDEADPDERLLLEVNIQSHQAAINRDFGIRNDSNFMEMRFRTAETHLGAFARKYPIDNYFKAEYLEVIHHNHGPQAALDTLQAWSTSAQKKLGFYIRFAAFLHLELDQLNEAKNLWLTLLEAAPDPTHLSPLVLEAQILIHQQKLDEGKTILDRVVQMDSNHLIARSMRDQLITSISH
ncbi:MAG: hypothetical protein HRU40_18775 [Saprospiraceae bacterium]|nr:hypothetical protein [Saprospiraceae bacterium]